jgi:hypothetical protein
MVVRASGAEVVKTGRTVRSAPFCIERDFVTFRSYSASHPTYNRGHTICFRIAN